MQRFHEGKSAVVSACKQWLAYPPHALLIIIIAGFAFPLDLGAHLGLSLPLSLLDVLIPLVLLCLLPQLHIPKAFTWLLLCSAFALVSIAVHAWSHPIGYRPLYSWGYFFKVYLAYVLGYNLLCDRSRFKVFLTAIVVANTVLVLLIYTTIPMAEWRGQLAVLGLSIFATNGINGFAGYISCVAMIAWGLAFDAERKHRYGYVAAAAIMSVLPYAVGSRQAVLASILFLIPFVLRYPKRLGVMIALSLAIAGLAYSVAYHASQQVAPGAQPVRPKNPVDHVVVSMNYKMHHSLFFMRTGNWDRLTAGRLNLYRAALGEWSHAKLWGRGFQGFSEQQSPQLLKLYKQLTGVSPHNQYLGALWKMGAVGFVFYMVFLVKVGVSFYQTYRQNVWLSRPLTWMAVICFGMFMMLQDFLTQPLTGCFFLIVAGGVQRLLDTPATDKVKLTSERVRREA